MPLTIKIVHNKRKTIYKPCLCGLGMDSLHQETYLACSACTAIATHFYAQSPCHQGSYRLNQFTEASDQFCGTISGKFIAFFSHFYQFLVRNESWNHSTSSANHREAICHVIVSCSLIGWSAMVAVASSSSVACVSKTLGEPLVKTM